jgi:curved DNA-binding protein CbpA
MRRVMLTPPDPIVPQAAKPADKPSRPSMPRAIPTPGVMSSGEVRTKPPTFRVPSTGRIEAAKHPSASTLEAVAPIVSPSDLGPTGVAARAMTVDNEGYFEVLGLTHGASVEAVRSTFFRLAKVWHPDRVPPDLAPLRDEVEKIFAAMTRAHQALVDPETRAAYLATKTKTEKRPRAQVLREIDGHLAKNDFASAEIEAKKLQDEDADDVEAIAVVAWCQAHGGDAPEETLRASLAMLDRSVYGDRYCERAYYYRGVLHRRTGNDAAAFRDFSRVVQISPKHVDAQRELRLHEMRSRKSSGEHILSLFSTKKK